MASNDVVVRLRAIGQAAFTSAMDEASHSVRGIGTSADKSGRQVEQSGKQATKSGRNWRSAAGSVAKWAGGAAALYAAKRGIEGSVTATEDLAKSTMTIQRATGLDTKTASSWVQITKARGVNTKQFQVGLVKLSKTMEAARGGNKKATETLGKYGVTSDLVAKGNVGDSISRIADSFALMKNPAEKAALAQQLFGKSGQALVPLLQGGSSGIEEQMKMAQQYGATLSDTKGAKEMIARQREMKIAMEGLKVSVGTALLPIIESLSQVLLKVVQVMQPLLRNSTALKIILTLLAVAFTTYKVAVIASTIATMTFNTALLLIPLAVAAIVAGVILLYTKWGWFHRAVDNTFAWIKAHWPLLIAILTGPIGLAVLTIVRNFDKIKGAVQSVIRWIGQIPGKVGAIAGQVASKAGAIGRALVRGITGAFKAVGGFAADIGRAVGDWINAHTIFGDEIKIGPAHVRIPALAEGGLVTSAGMALVGERGPELLQLPGGSRVTPLARPTLAMSAPSLGGVTTTANFYLDRRLVGSAVARDTADRKARR